MIRCNVEEKSLQKKGVEREEKKGFASRIIIPTDPPPHSQWPVFTFTFEIGRKKEKKLLLLRRPGANVIKHFTAVSYAFS